MLLVRAIRGCVGGLAGLFGQCSGARKGSQRRGMDVPEEGEEKQEGKVEGGE